MLQLTGAGSAAVEGGELPPLSTCCRTLGGLMPMSSYSSGCVSGSSTASLICTRAPHGPRDPCPTEPPPDGGTSSAAKRPAVHAGCRPTTAWPPPPFQPPQIPHPHLLDLLLQAAHVGVRLRGRLLHLHHAHSWVRLVCQDAHHLVALRGCWEKGKRGERGSKRTQGEPARKKRKLCTMILLRNLPRQNNTKPYPPSAPCCAGARWTPAPAASCPQTT
jgi:hypothetical protein